MAAHGNARLALLALLLSLSVAKAQEAPCLQRTVLVTAMQNDGSQISGLGTDSFNARMGRQRILVNSVTPGPAEKRGLLLIDVSASMGRDNDPEKWPTAVAISAQIVSDAPANVSLAMVAFSDKFLEHVEFGTTARSEIATKLHSYPGIAPLGRTPLLDAIGQAVGVFASPRAGDEIFLITDAGDNYSKHTLEQVRSRLLASGVRLNLFYIRATALTRIGHHSDDQPEVFSTLALDSGGWAVEVPASLSRENQRVQGAVNGAVQAIVSHPSVQVQVRLQRELTKWRNWDLRLPNGQGHKKDDVVLLYPHFLGPIACSK